MPPNLIVSSVIDLQNLIERVSDSLDLLGDSPVADLDERRVRLILSFLSTLRGSLDTLEMILALENQCLGL